MKTVTLPKADFDFIVDNALNGLFNECETKLNQLFLGEIERKNLIECKNKCKELMLLIDPNCLV